MRACVVAGPAAQAQTAPAAKGPEIIEVYSDADAQAVLNARIVALKAALELTPEQEKLWPSVEASIRAIAADSMARGKKPSQARTPADFLEVLERVADAEATRAADVKSLVAAARPFAASFSEAQKHRIPAFLGMVANAEAPLTGGSLWLFEEEER